MNEILQPFKLSIFNPIGTLGADIFELGIDSVLEDGLLKDIPIVGAIISLCKFGHNIQDRNFLKQTLIFIQSFNDGSIESEKLDEYRQLISSNKKKAEAELGRIIILLNSHIETIQSKSLGNLYRAYVNGTILWERFVELSEANKRMFECDYDVLNNEYIKNTGIAEYPNIHKYDRLISLGLMAEISKGGFAQSMETMAQKWIMLTSFGTLFCELKD